MRLSVLVVTLAGLCLTAPPSQAQGLSPGGTTKSRDALFAQQKKLLDGRLSKQYAASARLTPKGKKTATTSTSGMVPRYSGRYKGEWLAAARAAATRHNVPEDLFLRLVQQESGFNPGAVSSKGATGLAQLMPDTARLLGVDISDPHQNLDGGARYLARMHARFGNWRLALAAYNAGPEAVAKHGGVPPYAETQGYVKAILGE
ncbi:MAG: lytic transglycosylase domain-containing protein [Gemmobacter sp.]|nr:lytic transglycosylase domain-containing protein [Gemmobacter sp.]